MNPIQPHLRPLPLSATHNDTATADDDDDVSGATVAPATRAEVISNPFPSPTSSQSSSRREHEITVASAARPLDTLRDWTAAAFKYHKQRVQERLGAPVQRSSDASLDAQVESLRHAQRQHAQMLRLTQRTAAHVASLQRDVAQLGELFGEMALRERGSELRHAYGTLATTTRAITREGNQSLLINLLLTVY